MGFSKTSSQKWGWAYLKQSLKVLRVLKSLSQDSINKAKNKSKNFSITDLELVLAESDSEKSNDKPETTNFVNEDELNRVITFSSELAKFAKKGTSSDTISFDPLFEFDENSNVNEKINNYNSEMYPSQEIDLGASKQIMNPANYKELTHGSEFAATNARRHLSEGAQMQIFGLNWLEKPEAKTLEDRESPKFSTWSENEEVKSRLSSRRRELKSIKLSTFSSQRIKAPKARKVKRWILIDNQSEMTTLFKMVCQALNCKLDIAVNNHGALEKFKDSITKNANYKAIFINVKTDQIDDYTKLIHSIRDLEASKNQDSIPIWCFTDGEPHNDLTDLADEGMIDEPYPKPIKQDTLMDYILN